MRDFLKRRRRSSDWSERDVPTFKQYWSPGQEQVVNIDRVNCLIFNPEIESIGERFLSMNASLEIVVVIRSAIALHRNELLRMSPCIQ